jgi:hypothetical protein
MHLAGDLNAKHPSWYILSAQKLLQLFDTSYFEISTPQCPTHGKWIYTGYCGAQEYQTLRCQCL